MLPTLSLAVALLWPFCDASGSEELKFLVMGDWGGSPSHGLFHTPFTTADERATAVGMGNVGEATSAKFALALGDNFYDTGVPNVESSRFKYTFEDVFTAKSLQSKVCPSRC